MAGFTSEKFLNKSGLNGGSFIPSRTKGRLESEPHKIIGK